MSEAVFLYVYYYIVCMSKNFIAKIKSLFHKLLILISSDNKIIIITSQFLKYSIEDWRFGRAINYAINIILYYLILLNIFNILLIGY